MTVRANKPASNVREKLKELDYAHVPYHKMPPGSVIQVYSGRKKNKVQLLKYQQMNLVEQYLVHQDLQILARVICLKLFHSVQSLMIQRYCCNRQMYPCMNMQITVTVFT